MATTTLNLIYRKFTKIFDKKNKMSPNSLVIYQILP